MPKHLIVKCYSFAPITVHFLQTISRRLCISESELARRIVDTAMYEWVTRGVYEIPDDTQALPEEPSTRTYAKLTPEKLQRLRNGKPPHDTPTVA